jgi:hypothetical protein
MYFQDSAPERFRRMLTGSRMGTRTKGSHPAACMHGEMNACCALWGGRSFKRAGSGSAQRIRAAAGHNPDRTNSDPIWRGSAPLPRSARALCGARGRAGPCRCDANSDVMPIVMTLKNVVVTNHMSSVRQKTQPVRVCGVTNDSLPPSVNKTFTATAHAFRP